MQLTYRRGWRRTLAAVAIGLAVTITMFATTATAANADDPSLPFTPSGPPLSFEADPDSIRDAGQFGLVGATGAQCLAESMADGLNVRVEPFVEADSVGQLFDGYVVPWDCWLYTGGDYTACGYSSNLWAGVYWNNTWGFAAATCLTEA